MANTVMQVIRSSVAGRIPTTSNIPNAGTLALNMPDKLLFTTNSTAVFPINNSWPDIPHAFYGGI